jgi:hypothetical protein
MVVFKYYLQDRAEGLAVSAHPQIPMLLTPHARTWSNGPLLVLMTAAVPISGQRRRSSTGRLTG